MNFCLYEVPILRDRCVCVKFSVGDFHSALINFLRNYAVEGVLYSGA